MLDADQALSAVDVAQWALSYGEHVLTDAEMCGASADEILRLCDEVIDRRIQLQLRRLEAGQRVPLDALAQLERDELLIREFVPAASRG